jgi:hypothetical protein
MLFGSIHECGDENRCCYTTVSDDSDASVCYLTGRVLSKHITPASESQWDDRLDRKGIAQQMKRESGDARRDSLLPPQGIKRKRGEEEQQQQRTWTFDDLQWTGRRFPVLAKDDGEALIRITMRTVCNVLYESTAAAKLMNSLGLSATRTRTPENTLATASDLAARLRLIIIHSKPYESANAFVSPEKLCLFVLYEIMRKGKNEPQFYRCEPADPFVVKTTPALLNLWTLQITCSSSKKVIRAPDINKMRSTVGKCISYWIRLRQNESADALQKKKWTPFDLQSVQNTTK